LSVLFEEEDIGMSNEQAALRREDVSDTTDAGRSEECRERAGLYGLLGRCLEAEVDDSLLIALRGTLRDPLSEAGVTMEPAFFTTDADELLADLAEEYTSLLVAPGGVMPYASVFETGRLFQEAADRAERAYREAGWRFERRQSGEFPDHVGTMLSFVGILYDAECRDLVSGDGDGARKWRRQRERFVLEQLAPWVVGWCQRARRATMQVFYEQVLALIERVLWFEVKELADRRQLKEIAALNARSPVKLDYNADFRKASGL
jgi:TorA maturation chaperone TorD